MDGDRLDGVAGRLAEGAADRRERLGRPEDAEVARPGGLVRDRHLARSRPAAAPGPPSRRRSRRPARRIRGRSGSSSAAREPQFAQLAAGMDLLPACASGRAPAAPRRRGGAAARPARGSPRPRPCPVRWSNSSSFSAASARSRSSARAIRCARPRPGLRRGGRRLRRGSRRNGAATSSTHATASSAPSASHISSSRARTSTGTSSPACPAWRRRRRARSGRRRRRRGRA